jgi:tRNA(Ile)-lysidine synthase
VLYRLAVSPGSRALQGMDARRGRLVRPLLEVTRDEVREYLRARYLQWREDPSNADSRFARARVRHEVLPALRHLSEKAELTVAETARQLREEAEVLDIVASDALGAIGGGPAVPLDSLEPLPAALRRLVLRRLAEDAAGGPRPLSRREAEEIAALGREGSRSLDLGGGLQAVAEYGTVRFELERGEPASPDPVELAVPGSVRFGDWEVEAAFDARGDVAVSAAAVGPRLVVRSWREGDRMRPLGLGGSKSLQDLFTDRKVPRALRGELPVVEASGEIVWVAGVAVDERYATGEDDENAIALSARSTSA